MVTVLGSRQTEEGRRHWYQHKDRAGYGYHNCRLWPLPHTSLRQLVPHHWSAMAPFNAGVDRTKIRLIGRWNSWAMLRHLHVQSNTTMAGFARQMLSGGSFVSLVANPPPDREPENPSAPPVITPAAIAEPELSFSFPPTLLSCGDNFGLSFTGKFRFWGRWGLVKAQAPLVTIVQIYVCLEHEGARTDTGTHLHVNGSHRPEVPGKAAQPLQTPSRSTSTLG